MGIVTGIVVARLHGGLLAVQLAIVSIFFALQFAIAAIFIARQLAGFTTAARRQ